MIHHTLHGCILQRPMKIITLRPSGFSAGRNIAQCAFQLQGQRQITDITVRGLRQPGMTNTCLYNVLGPGVWTVVDCTAMFPSGGGMVKPQSLLPGSKKATDSTSSDCKTCEETSDNGSEATSKTADPTGGRRERGDPVTTRRSWWPFR